MQKLLKKAFRKAEQLKEDEQKSFGAFLLEELEHEKKWQEIIGKNQSRLQSLANEALQDYKEGKTKPMDFDKS